MLNVTKTTSKLNPIGRSEHIENAGFALTSLIVDITCILLMHQHYEH